MLIKKQLKQSIVACLKAGALFSLPYALTYAIFAYADKLTNGFFGTQTAAIVRLLIPARFLGPFKDGYVPGLTLVLLLFILYVLGAIWKTRVGKYLLSLLDWTCSHVWFVGMIFGPLKRMSNILSVEGALAVGKPVEFEMTPGVLTYGLANGESFNQRLGKVVVTVYVPSSPPTGGFTFNVHADKVFVRDDLTAADIVRIAASFGLDAPTTSRSHPWTETRADNQDVH